MAGEGAGVGAGQQGQGDDRGGDPDPYLREGERRLRGRGRDVAGGEEAEAARADVSGDAGDDGFAEFDDLPQEPDQGGRVRGSLRSAPAEKVVPVWVRTIARTSGSLAQSVSAADSSPTRAAERALRLCGESRVRVSTARARVRATGVIRVP